MEQVELISLYDYLGYAAGAELGKQVATAATRAKEQIGKRTISNIRYKGEVLLYRRQFLKEYFNKQQNPDVELSVSDHQDYNQWLTNNMNTTTIFNGYSGTVSSGTTATTLGHSGTSTITIADGSGLTLQGNSTLNYSTNQIQNNMTPKQVNVAVFTIKRDKDTNEINSTKFVKQLWVEQKNGTSIDLLVAKELGNDFDPETTVIKVLTTVSF